MKKLFISVLFLLYNFSLCAQDTKGTEFLLTFGENNNEGYPTELQIRIVSGGVATTGTIHFTKSGETVSFSINAGQVYTHVLTLEQKEVCYNFFEEVHPQPASSLRDNSSVLIKTSAPVTAYALNQSYTTTDATNILPVTALGMEYYCMSNNPVGHDAFAVVAVQDNTVVYYNGSVLVTLNKDEVYYHTSYTDMTGNHITADKPVALFAMLQSANIPRNFGTADHLFQQLAPVNTWGQNFLVPVSWLQRDIVRVLASQNNTIITQRGGKNIPYPYTDAPITHNLNAGQFIDFMVPLSSYGCYIQANKPVAVCTYLSGMDYHGMGIESDPAQAWLPSLEQKAETALIAPFISKGKTSINKHFAMIITPTATKNNTKIKTGIEAERTLSGGRWYDNAASGMSFYSLPLSPIDSVSAYTISNTAGVIVMGYGTGDYESYYYLAGSAMRWDVAFYVNDIYFKELASEIFCTQPTKFRAEILGEFSIVPGALKWYINGVEEVAARDSLSWSKELPAGTYQIKLEALIAGGEIVTAEGNIKIEQPPVLEQPEDVKLCAEEIFSGISFTVSNADGCTWEVTSGSGTEIGMDANSGTENISSFTALNNDSVPVVVGITVTPKTLNYCIGEPKIFTITVYPLSPVEVHLGSDTSICWLDSLRLNASHPNATSYRWQDESTGTTYTVYQDNNGEYWVVLKGSQCDTQVSDTINISYLADIHVNLGKDTTFCDGEIYMQWDVTAPYASYVWQDGATSPVYTTEEQGVYWVEVSNACMTARDEIEIQNINCHLYFNIPNIFTPNGDGMNDTFGPEFIPLENVKEFQMYIYDRWGRLVFSTTDTQASWNGNNQNGKPHAEGVYYCVLFYKDVFGKEHTYHISVTLIR